MSNNYYDATGVLVLDRITPVITALFGGFNLDETYPGDGETYIARTSEGSDPQWDDIRDNLVELAYQLGRPFPEDEEPSIQSYLRLLAKHFSAESDPQLDHLLRAHRFEDGAELDTLFVVARCFDDGHGLRAIRFEDVGTATGRVSSSLAATACSSAATSPSTAARPAPWNSGRTCTRRFRPAILTRRPPGSRSKPSACSPVSAMTPPADPCA